MIPEDPKVDLAETIDRIDQRLVVLDPLPRVWQLCLVQEYGLCFVPVAVRQVVIGSMPHGLLRVVAPAARVAALVAVVPDRAPQHGRPLAELLHEPFPFSKQLTVGGFPHDPKQYIRLRYKCKKKMQFFSFFFHPCSASYCMASAALSVVGRQYLLRRLPLLKSIPSSSTPSSQAAISLRPVSLNGN